MGNSFCLCDKNDQNINSYLIKGDINLQENHPENNNKPKSNINDKKNPESCTYSNSNHRNENENENENEIDDNVEENEEENNNENEQEEEKAEESEINDENINNDKNENQNTEIEKLQNINIFKEKIKPISSEISETQFEEATPASILNIEKNLENFDQTQEKIQELLQKITPQNNINFPPLLFNDNKIIYSGMWNISGIKEGFGTMLDSKGNKYQGGFFNDLFEAYGRIISTEGDWYEGEWKKGNIEGKGKYPNLFDILLLNKKLK